MRASSNGACSDRIDGLTTWTQRPYIQWCPRPMSCDMHVPNDVHAVVIVIGLVGQRPGPKAGLERGLVHLSTLAAKRIEAWALSRLGHEPCGCSELQRAQFKLGRLASWSLNTHNIRPSTPRLDRKAAPSRRVAPRDEGFRDIRRWWRVWNDRDVPTASRERFSASCACGGHRCVHANAALAGPGPRLTELSRS
jgi:hypothetical protein